MELDVRRSDLKQLRFGLVLIRVVLMMAGYMGLDGEGSRKKVPRVGWG